jgi:hypothetical protein
LLIAQSLGFEFNLCVNTSSSNGKARRGPSGETSNNGCDKVDWSKLSLGLGLSYTTSLYTRTTESTEIGVTYESQSRVRVIMSYMTSYESQVQI